MCGLAVAGPGMATGGAGPAVTGLIRPTVAHTGTADDGRTGVVRTSGLAATGGNAAVVPVSAGIMQSIEQNSTSRLPR